MPTSIRGQKQPPFVLWNENERTGLRLPSSTTFEGLFNVGRSIIMLRETKELEELRWNDQVDATCRLIGLL